MPAVSCLLFLRYSCRAEAPTLSRGSFSSTTWLPGLIAIAGAMLLVWHWSAGQPFWADEEMLALNLRDRSFRELAAPLWLDQSAPLGWLAIQHTVLLAFGTSERALRLVPLLFGMGTLGCAVWVGRRWLGVAGATLLALLCAVGPWLAYHALELKPYSSDAFWALLLLGLAAWVLDAIGAADAHNAVRRLRAWWAVAAIGLWFGNGALLVMPACASVLHVVLWRRHGVRPSAAAAVGAAGWLASFALHYQLAVRYSVESASLQRYWSFAMAPASGGLAGTARWALASLRSLAWKPAGTTHALLFWLLVLAGVGLAVRRRPAAGIILALIPLSAFALGALRLVPLYERLSLWVLPALYVALAVAGDAVARLAGSGAGRRRALAGLMAAAAAVPIGLVISDVTRQGAFLLHRPSKDNHALDDRSGVRSLLRQRRAGDVYLTTRLALPAVWWYDGASWTPPGAKAAQVPVFEARVVPERAGCAASLRAQLGGASRVLLYLGFRTDDWPPAREDLLLSRLAARPAKPW